MCVCIGACIICVYADAHAYVEAEAVGRLVELLHIVDVYIDLLVKQTARHMYQPYLADAYAHAPCAQVKQLGAGLRRLVLVSSHGTLRCGQMPFSLRNLLGQLDKLRAAEQEVTLKASRDLPCHSILRVGKLEVARGGGGAAAGGLVTLSPGDDFDGKSSVTSSNLVVTIRIVTPVGGST